MDVWVGVSGKGSARRMYFWACGYGIVNALPYVFLGRRVWEKGRWLGGLVRIGIVGMCGI